MESTRGLRLVPPPPERGASPTRERKAHSPGLPANESTPHAETSRKEEILIDKGLRLVPSQPQRGASPSPERRAHAPDRPVVRSAVHIETAFASRQEMDPAHQSTPYEASEFTTGMRLVPSPHKESAPYPVERKAHTPGRPGYRSTPHPETES
ncbi:hypothetical protein B484DRAFT_394418, partial [Ochromonadaceae sp. CCMP2298]